MSRLSRSNVESLYNGQTLYHHSYRNADGTPVRCRINGRCKTWVTRPDQFRLPVKHGLKECFYITDENCNEWFTTEEEAANQDVNTLQVGTNEEE